MTMKIKQRNVQVKVNHKNVVSVNQIKCQGPIKVVLLLLTEASFILHALFSLNK